MKLFKLSIALVTLALMVIVNANIFSQSGTGMGLESGLNLANMNLTPNLNSGSRTGFMVGGFSDIAISKVVSIRPGIRFVTKGFSIANNNQTINVKLSYLDLPMLIKASIPLDRIKPYFMAGPTLGINLSASIESTDGTNVQDGDASQSFETIDFGLYFGSGIEFHVAPGTDLFTGFGYSLGLTNVSKINGLTAKNNGFQVTGGVKFGI